MRRAYIVMCREVASTWRSPSWAVIVAVALALDGLMFNAWAIAGTATSSQVLEAFFYCTSGTTLMASVFMGMRLIAEERQTGTLVLLSTSPLKDWQLVAGKFAAAWLLLAALTLLSAYMPALVALHGNISLGHVAVGYLGLLLLGGAALSLGLLASALSPNQLVAVVLGAAFVVIFLLMWLLSRVAQPPVDELLAYLSLHDKHFRPFMRGVLSVADVVFYLSLTWVSLLAATRVLEARRWA